MSVINTSELQGNPIPPTAAPLLPLGGVPIRRPARFRSARRRAISGAPGHLHRLAEVRRREGITRRQLAWRLGVTVAEVKRQEAPSCDIGLGELYRWQQALGVPMAELLSEPPSELSPPVQFRAQLLRIMKTVRSIETGRGEGSIRRLTTMLVKQLVEVMPELKNALAWPTGDKRHGDPIEPFDWRAFCQRTDP